jgi:hypothetical protein
MRLYRAYVTACLACIGYSQAALGSDWRQIGAVPDGLVYVDLESIAPRGQYVRAWWRLDYDSPRKTTAVDPPREYRSARYQSAFNCTEQSSAAVQSVLVAGELGQGEIVDRLRTPWNQLRFVKFHDPAPDSVAKRLLRTVCGARR